MESASEVIESIRVNHSQTEKIFMPPISRAVTIHLFNDKVLQFWWKVKEWSLSLWCGFAEIGIGIRCQVGHDAVSCWLFEVSKG